MSRPWLQFYPADWRSDPRLRLCSRAARGLWIDMLSIMHEATPYGELRVGEVVLDATSLARVLGEPVDDVSADLVELERAGVFSRRRNGVIFSRRMVRDEEKRRKLRENGKKGGNPSLSKQKKKAELDNPPDKPTEARDQIPETKEEEKARERAPIQLPSEDVRQVFARIWERLPAQARRLGEPGGMMAFGRAITNGADPAEIERAVGPWLAASPDGIVERFDRWLSGDKWREWLPKAPPKQAESELSFVLHFQRTGDWLGQGAPPSPERCEQILAAHGYGERKTG